MNQSALKDQAANKKKIAWVEISSKKYGGFMYRQQAREALVKDFTVELISAEPKHLKQFKYLKFLEIFCRLLRLKGKRDAWIRDYFPALLLRVRKTTGKNIIMVHHIDVSGFPLIARPVLHLLTKIFYHNLKKADAIITRAEEWRKHFIDRGYKNVYKIYGGFDLSKFNISEQEVEEFKKTNNIVGKPIIYIGNAQKAKGAEESYGALKDLDAYLVTSGKKKINIPALNFDLDYTGYLKLLKASSIVVTMSKFKEGWCRTAHEAMLCKTPIIGSGAGGMKELLEGGKQIICADFNELKTKVQYLLDHQEERKRMGESGYDFAKNFTLEKFQQEWRDLIKEILK